MTKTRAIVGLAGALFLGLCALAYLQVGGSGFDRVLAEPWGLVTLADVMLGGVCMAAVIFRVETDWRVALAWSLPIFLLGHIVSAAWVMARLARQIGAKPITESAATSASQDAI